MHLFFDCGLSLSFEPFPLIQCTVPALSVPRDVLSALYALYAKHNMHNVILTKIVILAKLRLALVVQ
jgi:hypothetical protein